MSETVRRLAALHQAARAMNSVLDPDELLDRILSLLQDVFALDTCAVLLYEPDDQVLTIRAAKGYRADVVSNFKAAKGEGVTGHVLVTGEPGTARKSLARRIHDRSERSAGPFVDVSCANLSTVR